MATLTAGKVFRLAKRFVEASRGTAVILTGPFLCNSAGPVRFTHGPCGLQEQKQTAAPFDRPPDRRTNALILTTIRTTHPGPLRILELRTNATRGSDKSDQTAGEPPHRTHRDEYVTGKANETLQTMEDADETKLTNAPAKSPTCRPLQLPRANAQGDILLTRTYTPICDRDWFGIPLRPRSHTVHTPLARGLPFLARQKSTIPTTFQLLGTGAGGGC